MRKLINILVLYSESGDRAYRLGRNEAQLLEKWKVDLKTTSDLGESNCVYGRRKTSFVLSKARLISFIQTTIGLKHTSYKS